MRFFKRSLIFLGLSGLLFIVTGAVLVYYFQDQLVSEFVKEANKRIDTPIHTESIKASWWEKFPDVSIVLNEVIIDGSLPGGTDTLATAQNIFCTFNAWDILRGKWVVDEIHMENGRLFLVQTELGDNNFTIVNRDSSQNRTDNGFKLEEIQLQDVEIAFLDLDKLQEYHLHSNDVVASLDSKGDYYDILLAGSVKSKNILIKDREFFSSKDLTLEAELTYLKPDKKWVIEASEITVNESTFLVNGYYQGSNQELDISIKGHDTDIQTVFSVLPEEVVSKFRKYRSKGDLYFAGQLSGSVADGERLKANVEFGCRNAFFYHPDLKKGIESVYLTGSYISPQADQISEATLALREVRGSMENQKFSGNLTIHNLENYHIKGAFEGTFDLNSWHQFLPSGEVASANGEMSLDISFDGPVDYLSSTKAMDKFSTSGEVFITDLSFSLNKNSLPFDNFNGHFLFNGRDLAISDFTGNIGSSDFELNGFFRNIIAFIFSKNQPIGIEADLKAHNLDLDELLTGNLKSKDNTLAEKQTYTSFEISPRLELLFNTEVDQLKFRRFQGREIKGKLKISNQVALGEQISFSTMGGEIMMNGRVDGRIKDHIKVQTRSSYQGINLDSLFYVFENFGQDFLEDRHLKGQAYADIDTYMAFDNYLRFKSPDLVVQAGLVIENGELNDFEPLQKLSTYIDPQDLKHLQFADLKNNIQIKNREILLPNMVVKSNLTTISINGSHTFDQDIDYRLKVPIKRTKKDKDEYFGALEDDGLNTNLFLRITGTTKDYQVIYDKAAVKNKIKQDLREEKWEIRDAVRNKGNESSTQELDEEDFFDFDDADSTALQQ